MTFEQPYKFKGGTSAKAQEVNANFDYVGDYLEGIETVQVGLEGEINSLDENKAEKQGSSNVQFNVAPAISDNNAVPLSQLNDFLYIIKGMYRGFTLTKYQTSPSGKDWGLIIAPGAGFDSTENYLIKNLASISKSFEGQITMPGTTYHVWVTATTTEPTNVDLVVGLGSSPSIGTGGIYKRIANITTGSEGFGTITYADGRVS